MCPSSASFQSHHVEVLNLGSSFEVLVIYFFGLAHGPCVGVVAGSELLLILEAMLALRVPELIFAPDFCLLCCSVIGGEVVEIIEECVHVDAR